MITFFEYLQEAKDPFGPTAYASSSDAFDWLYKAVKRWSNLDAELQSESHKASKLIDEMDIIVKDSSVSMKAIKSCGFYKADAKKILGNDIGDGWSLWRTKDPYAIGKLLTQVKEKYPELLKRKVKIE